MSRLTTETDPCVQHSSRQQRVSRVLTGLRSAGLDGLRVDNDSCLSPVRGEVRCLKYFATCLACLAVVSVRGREIGICVDCKGLVSPYSKNDAARWVLMYCWLAGYISQIPCSIVLEVLTGPQLVEKFSAYDGIRRCIAVLARARHLSLFWARLIHSTHAILFLRRSMLILSFHRCSKWSPSHRFSQQNPLCTISLHPCNVQLIPAANGIYSRPRCLYCVH
jgi:hypothetical protein